MSRKERPPNSVNSCEIAEPGELELIGKKVFGTDQRSSSTVRELTESELEKFEETCLGGLAAYPMEISGLLKQTGNKNPFTGERFKLFRELCRVNDKGGDGVYLDQFKDNISQELLFSVEVAQGDCILKTGLSDNISKLVEHWKIYKIPVDKRGRSSPQNGQKGGRPQADYILAAIDFCDHEFGGKANLTKYRHEHWCYKERELKWVKVPDEDLKSMCTKFLQKNGKRYNMSPSKNSIINLCAQFCGLNYVTEDTEVPARYFDEGWRSNPELMVFSNGCLSITDILENGAYYTDPITNEVFFTQSFGYDYDPKADCPLFKEVINDLLPEPEQREQLQMQFGYAISRKTNYNVMMFWYGESGTGKSTIVDVLKDLVGKEDCCHVQLHDYGERFKNVPLTENSLNIVGDGHTESADHGTLRKCEGIMKDASDGGTLQVERKGKDPYDAMVTARLFLLTNDLPKFSDKSGGIWDRLRIVAFNEVIRGTSKQDKDLRTKLKKELPGIFNWALEGFDKLRKHQYFPESDVGGKIKAQYRLRCNPLKEYLISAYEEGPKYEVISTQKAFNDYRDHCSNTNTHPVAQGKFVDAVKVEFSRVSVKRANLDSTRKMAFHCLKEKVWEQN